MSQQSWSPLRIKKPTDSPSSSPELIRRPLAPRGPAAPSSSSSDEQLCGPRRTSGSFKHVSTNSLVSNSIFKRGEASPASPSHSPASPKRPSYTASAPRFTNGRSDSSSSIGLGIASERAERKPTLQERRASREKLDLENVAPLAVNIERAAGGSFKPQRKARQSTAYNSLLTNEPVSKSPFLIYGPTGTPDSPVEERKPSPKELQRAITPPPLTSDLTPRSTNNSPLRSAMANSSALSPTKRMQGPRYPTPDSYVKEEPVEETEALTPRRKTVIFADDDALEDVFEFEVESRRESLNSMASSEDSRFSEDSSESGEVALDLSGASSPLYVVEVCPEA